MSVPTTNAEFLAAIHGPVPAGVTPWVCGFVGHPKHVGGSSWGGWVPALGTDGPNTNWYFTLARYRGTRAAKNCVDAAGVMLDDLNAEQVAALALRPACATETSPGNWQVIYLFPVPMTDLAQVDSLQKALIRAGLCDPNADGPAARYSRLPNGVNGKSSPPWQCRLTEFDATRRYSIEQIVSALGLTLDAPSPARQSVEFDDLPEAKQAELLADIDSALPFINADERNDWVSVGHGLASLGEAGRERFARWSRTSHKYRDGDEDRFDTFSPDRTGWASIFKRAAAAGWVNPRARQQIDLAAVFGTGPVALPPGASLTPLAPVVASPVPPPPTAADTSTKRYFAAAAIEPMRATLENVTDTLASKASGVELRLDDFTGSILISGSDRSGRPLDDDDLGVLRAEFGRRGFKPISPEVMKTSVRMVAKANRFDAARDWADSLKWDGVQRIDMALATHFGATATAYVQGVGRYLFSALAGRALVPGIRADMALVLIGMQGARKTSAVAALSPDPRFFTEINLARIDHDDTARRLRGKLVGELSELRGLRGRDQESVKAWITRRIEAWTPKYMEFEATYPRRLILIGTTNEREFLDDVTGERRWLPVEVGAVDVDALERDRDQLWAEGVARFKASGIAWQDAERLARAEHARFKVVDAWEDLVSTWLAGSAVPGGLPRSTGPFRLQDVAVGALGRSVQSMQRPDELRLAKVLRSLGYDKSTSRIGGTLCKAWTCRNVTPLPINDR
jgi:hypothetical protein